MRKVVFILGATALLTANTALAETSNTSEVVSPISNLFIPNGFDDNDIVEVVVAGSFPNTCYRTGHTGVEVDHEAKMIHVDATSYSYDAAEFCAMVLTPFSQVVRVGILEQGNYEVMVNNIPGIVRDLDVRERTTESPDDHLYAPVEHAEIDIDRQTGRQSLVLKGTFPILLEGCAVMREVMTSYDPADVLVVQPVMEFVTGSECDDHALEFKHTSGLPQPFYGKGLIHVRVLNGNSLNRVVDISPNW